MAWLVWLCVLSAAYIPYSCLPGSGKAPFAPSSSPLEAKRIAITILRTGAVADHLQDCGCTMVIRELWGE
jgi:hypothetical protein